MCCFPHAGSILNELGRQVAAGARFAEAEQAWDPGGAGTVRFGIVHPGQWRTERFNTWRRYDAGRPWSPTPAALQVITCNRHDRWQDDLANRRWRYDRLDRAPHVPYSRAARRR